MKKEKLTKVDYANLPLSDDFMFADIMRREKICTLFLEELLQKPIARIEYANKQQDLSDSKRYHGIRLDVYLQDEEKTVYNVEMQTTDAKVLERRCRYYQAGIDRSLLERGHKYNELPDSYIIFVCDFDYFHAGLPVYERVSCLCGRSDLGYNDGSHVFILNSKYTSRENTSPAILEFLDCIRTNNISNAYQSDLMKEICPAIEEVRKDEAKEGLYMTIAEKIKEAQENSHAEGRAETIRAMKGLVSAADIAERLGVTEAYVNELWDDINSEAE